MELIMKPWGKHTLAAAFFVSGLATGLALSSNALKPLIVDNVLSGAVIASKWLESSYLRNDTAPSAGQGSLNLTPEPAYNKGAIFAWGLGGAFFLIWIIRRRKRMAIKDVDRTNALGVDGAKMDSLTAQMPSAAPIEVPRSLIQNPFSNEIEGFDFETRVQWAISGSLR
ncbi:MAG: hypothetical protein Q8M31_09245, partial [Beijerinckiaceae bacterium]|nr:hypothetical protein [Beijerinckiaceae bacterium]